MGWTDFNLTDCVIDHSHYSSSEAIKLWDGKSHEGAVSICLVSMPYFSEGLEISDGAPESHGCC